MGNAWFQQRTGAAAESCVALEKEVKKVVLPRARDIDTWLLRRNGAPGLALMVELHEVTIEMPSPALEEATASLEMPSLDLEEASLERPPLRVRTCKGKGRGRGRRLR